ncbi:hypothetical protein JTB14_031304 [Gonioctena quinquepunctata]|nr:hypothetical protein JTB14_031304 [Gonioctena quinquepunctata]
MEVAEDGMRRVKEHNYVFYDILKEEMVKEEPFEIEPFSKYVENCSEQIQDLWEIDDELRAEVDQIDNGVVLKNANEENFECDDDSSTNNAGLKTEISNTENEIDYTYRGIKIEPSSSPEFSTDYGVEHQHNATEEGQKTKGEMIKEEPVEIEPSSKYDKNCAKQIQDLWQIENDEGLKAEVDQFNEGVILNDANEENFECADDSSTKEPKLNQAPLLNPQQIME